MPLPTPLLRNEQRAWRAFSGMWYAVGLQLISQKSGGERATILENIINCGRELAIILQAILFSLDPSSV